MDFLDRLNGIGRKRGQEFSVRYEELWVEFTVLVVMLGCNQNNRPEQQRTLRDELVQ